MKSFFHYLLILIFISTTFNLGFGQKKHRKRARTAIKELKEGVLIVSIPTFQKKIDTLKSMIKKEMNKKDRIWLEEQLAKVESDRDIAPSRIQQGFKSNYNFSEVLFMHDTSYTYLKQGIYKNIFLNKEVVDLKERNFFIHRPTVLRTSNLMRDATIDKNFIPLEPPFPNIFRRRYSILDFYDPKEKNVFGSEYVKILNKQFWEYYYAADNRKWWHFFTREWKN